jgi:isoleucyl-tRNA synthetase
MFKDESEAQIKVRQPLSTLTYGGDKLDEFYESIIAEEVNVKAVTHAQDEAVALDKTITPELRREGLSREIIRHVQAARKNAGLNVDDRIHLSLMTEDADLEQAIGEYADTIASETLTEGMAIKEYAHKADVKIEGAQLTITLEKA